MPARISLLVDSPLRDMMIVLRKVPAELRKQIQQQTKAAAQPIWQQELREHADTRLEQLVLVKSGQVSVTQRNVTLISGKRGKLASGTPVIDLVSAVEHGGSPTKEVTQRSRTGRTYTRKMGAVFKPHTRKGHVFGPSADEAIQRLAKLWVQTAMRTLYDALDEKG